MDSAAAFPTAFPPPSPPRKVDPGCLVGSEGLRLCRVFAMVLSDAPIKNRKFWILSKTAPTRTNPERIYLTLITAVTIKPCVSRPSSKITDGSRHPTSLAMETSDAQPGFRKARIPLGPHRIVPRALQALNEWPMKPLWLFIWLVFCILTDA